MQQHRIDSWQHDHDFSTVAEVDAERRTRWVVYLTLAAMVVELATGWLSGSMALLADGWHMGSHAAALGLSVFAYLVGAALIGSWAWGLARESAITLVDAEDQGEMEDKIRDGDRIR